MFNCPDRSPRLYCGQTVANVVNKGFKIVEKCEEKPEEKDHPKVQKLRQALESFMDLVLNVIHTKECQKNWTRLEQFYDMIKTVCTGGKAQAEYLLARGNGSIVVELCDLILQKKSPKAGLDANGDSRVEMGGSANRAPFGPLVTVLSRVVRCMHTQTMGGEHGGGGGDSSSHTFMTFEDFYERQAPAKRVSQTVFMTEEALMYFTNKDLINIIMSCEYDIDNFADALAHVCYGNKKLSKDIFLITLKALVISEYNRISQYLRVVQSIIALDDSDHESGKSLLARRFEWIFGFPYLNVGYHVDEKHKIGLDSLNNNIRGEVITYQSMLSHDPHSNNSLLHLLWRHKNRNENYTMQCLNSLADIVTSSEKIMELFSNLPGVTYQYARYTDWIQPFLMSQLNKSTSYSNGAYEQTSKEDIVKAMSKFEIYDSYLTKKD